MQMLLECLTSEEEHSLPAGSNTYLKNRANNRIRFERLFRRSVKRSTLHLDVGSSQ